MSEAAAPATVEAGPPATASLQDPLPEASWLWRRIVSILIIGPAVLFNLGAGIGLYSLGEGQLLFQLGKWNLGFAALAALLYLAGANMAEITKLLQHSKLLEKGVIMQQTATAIGSDGSKATTTTTAGKPDPAAAPVPDLPPAPIAPAAPEVPAAEPAPAPVTRADTVTFPWENKP